jgi:hypothetical protein
VRLLRERAALPAVALKTPPAGVSASDAVDAEFILTTQPLDVAGYGRTHLPDGRLPPAVRYNVYLLGSEVVTIDLCMQKAPQHVASLYPKPGWNATLTAMPLEHSSCPQGNGRLGSTGAAVAARLTVVSTGGLSHRAVVLV